VRWFSPSSEVELGLPFEPNPPPFKLNKRLSSQNNPARRIVAALKTSELAEIGRPKKAATARPGLLQQIRITKP